MRVFVHVRTLCVSGLNSLLLRMSIFKFWMNRLHLSLSIGVWVCSNSVLSSLYVSRCVVSLSSSAPAHTIAQFTVCALQQSLTPPIPAAVTENFLFVCRQLYNTCEGLLVLKEYTLPKHIAAVWPQVSPLLVTYVQGNLSSNMYRIGFNFRGVEL